MTTLPTLEILKQHRQELLLAEVAAWLHDDFKHTDAFIHGYTINAPSPSGRQDTYDLVTTCSVNLLGKQLTFNVVKNRRKDDFLDEYLNRCHYAAHIEKQKTQTKQIYPAYVSSPFGFENTQIPPNLTQDLRQKISWQKIANDPFTTVERNTLQAEIKTLFSRVGGDTRRPMNEVLLWEWSAMVATLYKAALAGALLGYQPQARKLRWRLLGIRFEGLNYLLNAPRIPDLLARQELLTDGLNRVRELLEVIYPLGSEVYRDENGSIYVVPNIADLLNCSDNSGTTLQSLILQEFARGMVKDRHNLQLDGEIVPHIELEGVPWWGQDPDYIAKTKRDETTNQPINPQLYGQKLDNELPSIADFLAQNIVSSADPDWIMTFWQGGQVDDICSVCGLRPQGPSGKAKDRHVCDICEQRRADRSQEWATSQTDKTIWNDEVADVNGRMALITGQFDLRHWLDGSLLESLLVIAPHDGEPVASKTPSFSRLRRIWETTRTFWQEVQAEILQQLSDDRRRLKIYLDELPRLGPFHAYDLVVGASELSVVWVPSENNREGYLVSIDNLCYLARQLDAKTDIYEDPAASAIFVEDYLRAQFVEKSRQPILHNADSQTGREKQNLLDRISIREIGYQTNQYATAIPILTEPRTFMILVPADRALDVVSAIKGKYEREMGKVRNRLPLNVGAVFFSRRTPLFAALDSARQMLDRHSNAETWQVEGKTDLDPTDEGWPRTVQLTLTREDKSIPVKVSTVMGDNETKDVWYPYWRVEGKPTDRTHWFIGADGEHWVHVTELKEGDSVQFTPSTFDFLWLDAAARRFEIGYDADGRRPTAPSLPYYLEDLERLDKVWGTFSKLSRTQIKQILQTIETARERWFGPKFPGDPHDPGGVFRQFVEDTLANAQWDWKAIPEADREKLITAGVRGELADLAELHLEILKENMQGETS